MIHRTLPVAYAPGLPAPPEGYVWRLKWSDSVYFPGWELRIVPKNLLKRLFAYMEVEYDSEHLGVAPGHDLVAVAASRLRERHDQKHAGIVGGVYE